MNIAKSVDRNQNDVLLTLFENTSNKKGPPFSGSPCKYRINEIFRCLSYFEATAGRGRVAYSRM